MMVRLHSAHVAAPGRQAVDELHTSAPHIYFHEDGRAELRWSASDNAAHTHNTIVRVDIGAPEAEALRALVSRATRRAYGHDEAEPPPKTEPAPEPVDPTMPNWAPPEAPTRKDGKPWTPPGVEPEPMIEDEEKTP